jgi:hypothetical protein
MISKNACLMGLFIAFGSSAIALPALADLIVCRDGEKECRVIVILPDAKDEYVPPNNGGPDSEHGAGTRYQKGSEKPRHRGSGRN